LRDQEPIHRVFMVEGQTHGHLGVAHGNRQLRQSLRGYRAGNIGGDEADARFLAGLELGDEPASGDRADVFFVWMSAMAVRAVNDNVGSSMHYQ
jgi:hypothetical protein